MVTTFTIHSTQICIINCYLESARGYEANCEMSEDLDRIREICIKYQNYLIILAGDFNTDPYNRVGKKEQMLTPLIRELDFTDININTHQQPTYKHKSDNKHQSHVDLIFYKVPPGSKITLPAKRVHGFEDRYLNTSSHCPVLTNLRLQTVMNSGTRVPSQPRKTRNTFGRKLTSLFTTKR